MCSGEGLSVESIYFQREETLKAEYIHKCMQWIANSKQTIKDMKMWGSFSNLSHFLVFVTSSASVQSAVPDVPAAPQTLRLVLNKWGYRTANQMSRMSQTGMTAFHICLQMFCLHLAAANIAFQMRNPSYSVVKENLGV